MSKKKIDIESEASRVLQSAASYISRKGLAVGKPTDGEAVCTAVAIMEATGHSVEKWDAARSKFCAYLGIMNSYQGIVDWNDQQHRKRWKDIQIMVYSRTKDEVVKALREASQREAPQKESPVI